MTCSDKRHAIWFIFAMLSSFTASAWAIPINLAVGDFTLNGNSQNESIVKSCPPEIPCSSLPSFRTIISFVTPVAATANPLNLYVAETADTTGLSDLLAGNWASLTAAEQALLKNLGWAQNTWDTKGAGTGVMWPISTDSIMDRITFNQTSGAVEMNVDYVPGVDPTTLLLAIEDTATGAKDSTLINFKLTSVPEPPALVLLMIGFVCLCFGADKAFNQVRKTVSYYFAVRS